MKSTKRQSQFNFIHTARSEKEGVRRSWGLSLRRIVGNLLSCECACTSNFFNTGNVAFPVRDGCAWRAVNGQVLLDQLRRYQRPKTFYSQWTHHHCRVDHEC